MKIKRMSKGEWGKVKAFFSLETNEGFIITGLKIVDGINGMFVSMPSQQDKDGNYNDIVMATKDVRKSLNEIAISAYKKADTPRRMVGGMSEADRLQSSYDYADKDDGLSFGISNTKRVESFNDAKNVIKNSEDIPF